MRPSILFLIYTLSSSAQSPSAVDICTLFEAPSNWNGKLVRIDATLKNGHGEGGPWLSGENCKASIFIKGERFPNVLELVDPKSIFALHKVNYEWDEQSQEHYAAAVNRVDRKNEHIRLTVIGLFETREPLTDLILKGRDNGFGHQNGIPGQILVKTVTNILIQKNIMIR
jgi:hypothetical protein